MQHASILQTFSIAGREITPSRAEAIAVALACNPDLNACIAMASHADAFELYSDLIAFSSAKAERANPPLLIARLEREAGDLDRNAVPLWAQAAEFHGKATFRKAQGETDLAEQFTTRANACEKLASEYEHKAFSLRLLPAALKADSENAAALANVARPITPVRQLDPAQLRHLTLAHD